MAEYSQQEMVDMVICFGRSGNNASADARFYQGRYPNQRHPRSQVLKHIVQRFNETGSVAHHSRSGRPRTATNDDASLLVLAAVHANPHVSSRAIALDIGYCHKSVLNILHMNKFHPFHLHRVQGLEDTDFVKRREFCNLLLCQIDENPNFISKILWSDESQFTRDGIVNTHNCHYWAENNPHWIKQVKHQRNWQINVWCGIYNTRIIGPVFFTGTLTAERYCELILHGIVEEFLDNVPLNENLELWFQHDGAPPHFAAVTRNLLDQLFHNRQWIGRGGPMEWPPRSTDITPLDFFLWGHLKQEVYRTPLTTQDDMMERIRTACANISEETLHDMQQSIRFRAQVCFAENGRHFEHLL